MRRPLLFIAEPITRDPGATSTGTDSPVIKELSTELVPEIITPSVAIREPGLTTNSSPTINWEIGRITSTPACITATSFSPRARRDESALLARRFARDSR